MIDFHDYLESLGINDLNNWTFLKAHCISNDGTIIAGTSQNSSGGNWVTFIIDLEDELSNNLLGDVNGDGEINILDVVSILGFIIGSDSPSDSEFLAGDYNEDGDLNILDVVAIVSLIINN